MKNPERIAAFLGIAILASACADEKPVSPVATITPEPAKSTATATATATVTATPKVDFPELSPEQMAATLKKIQDARVVADEFISKNFGPVRINNESGSGPKYWAKSNQDPHKTLSSVRTGPDGILGFDIENTYGDDGKILQSIIFSNVVDKGYVDYIPTIGKYIKPLPAHHNNLGIPEGNLREVAYSLFNLPKNIKWVATTSEYEAGTKVPTAVGTGKLADGSDLEFSIDSFGRVSLTKTYPSPNLGFEQRFHPYRFAANGVLKPQYSPRKLGF